MAKLKTTMPRVVPLDDGRFAVDVAGLTLVLARDGDRWIINVDDGVTLSYRRDLCHVVIERERQQQKQVA